MVTKKPKVRYTYADYCQLPDDTRYELIDGEFYVVPSPGANHQWSSFKLARWMADFVESRLLGVVYIAPFDVILSDHDTLQPDILFVAADRQHIITARACEGPPDLVVEVLSPSTSRRDLVLKRERYARFGVREYWLVDPAARSIEVLTWQEGAFHSQGIYAGDMVPVSAVLPGFAFRADAIFPAE